MNANRAIKRIDKWLDAIFEAEGGYVNDPDDLGGETKYGISKRAFPQLDIKNLTKDEAIEIYIRDYWHKLNCDELEYGLDIAVFDVAVNMGTGRAEQFLEQIKDTKGSIQRIQAYNKLRREHYADIIRRKPNQKKYKKGWEDRIRKIERLIETDLKDLQ